jgi:hypothetical protein
MLLRGLDELASAWSIRRSPEHGREGELGARELVAWNLVLAELERAFEGDRRVGRRDLVARPPQRPRSPRRCATRIWDRTGIDPPREARKVRPCEHSAVGRRDAREPGSAGTFDARGVRVHGRAAAVSREGVGVFRGCSGWSVCGVGVGGALVRGCSTSTRCRHGGMQPQVGNDPGQPWSPSEPSVSAA